MYKLTFTKQELLFIKKCISHINANNVLNKEDTDIAANIFRKINKHINIRKDEV